MDYRSERGLREEAANLALAWSQAKRGEFAGATAEEFSEMIVAAHIVADESRLALHRWIDAGRRASLSWADIGGLVGISRQAAQQRFGGDGTRDAPGTAGAELVVLKGATAFNEVAMLEREGREGNELVSVGLFKLVFRQTGQLWEHRRLTAPGLSEARQELDAQGWKYVASWYPFHYLKRRGTMSQMDGA